MVSRLLQFFAFTALAVGCTAVAPTGCAVRASVDHHIARPALDASLTPIFGWQLSSGCAGAQRAYRIVVTTSATALVAAVVEAASNLATALFVSNVVA